MVLGVEDLKAHCTAMNRLYSLFFIQAALGRFVSLYSISFPLRPLALLRPSLHSNLLLLFFFCLFFFL
jgi:hypothetical protein